MTKILCNESDFFKNMGTKNSITPIKKSMLIMTPLTTIHKVLIKNNEEAIVVTLNNHDISPTIHTQSI